MTFGIEFRVRYSDVDERSVVNNARYLNYFEEARMAMLDDMRDCHQVDFSGKVIVAHAHCDYQKSLILRDTVRMETGISRIGIKSFDVGYKITNQLNEPIATGLTTQVHFDYVNRRTIALDEPQRIALNAYPFTEEETTR